MMPHPKNREGNNQSHEEGRNFADQKLRMDFYFFLYYMKQSFKLQDSSSKMMLIQQKGGLSCVVAILWSCLLD